MREMLWGRGERQGKGAAEDDQAHLCTCVLLLLCDLWLLVRGISGRFGSHLHCLFVRFQTEGNNISTSDPRPSFPVGLFFFSREQNFLASHSKYGRRVDPSALAFSLSSNRHSCTSSV